MNRKKQKKTEKAVSSTGTTQHTNTAALVCGTQPHCEIVN